MSRYLYAAIYLIDGESTRSHGGDRWTDVALGRGGLTWRGWEFHSRNSRRRVGSHKIECVVTQAMFRLFADPETTDPLWSQELALEGQVEVVPNNAPDPITLIENDLLIDVLQDAIRVYSVSRQSEDGRPDQLTASLFLDQPAPMCLAFDVVAVTESDEIAVGTLSWSKGEQGYGFVSPEPWFRLEEVSHYHIPSDVALELRASREVASMSVDCFDVWAGTLRFGSIQVTTD